MEVLDRPVPFSAVHNGHRVQVRVKDRATGALIAGQTAYLTVTDNGLNLAIETVGCGPYEITLVSTPRSRVDALIAVEDEVTRRRHANSRQIPDAAAGG
jgi:hypothetical protein